VSSNAVQQDLCVGARPEAVARSWRESARRFDASVIDGRSSAGGLVWSGGVWVVTDGDRASSDGGRMSRDRDRATTEGEHPSTDDCRRSTDFDRQSSDGDLASPDRNRPSTACSRTSLARPMQSHAICFSNRAEAA
jgi:hypothetical protein